MRHALRYAYMDLGELEAESTVVVRLHGSRANVLLLSQPNFFAYRTGRPFRYIGGRYGPSAVRLEIPRDDHWYAVVDLGGYSGTTQASVEVLHPDGSVQRLDSARSEAPSTAA